ncbi:MAG: CHAP domain-containing protein [Nitrospirae bacterium]|nr:CHAP domain-containing protein [Nitrospirota bacterium]
MKGLKVRGWEVVTVAIFIVMAMAATALARDTYLDLGYNCPSDGVSGTKADQFGFIRCNCTSYAAKKMSEHGVDIHDTYLTVSGKTTHEGWHHAKNWIAATKAAMNAGADISYNTSPKHRDIAVWTGGTYGHVAYVESVDSKGNITVSDYNHDGKLVYASSRTLSIATKGMDPNKKGYPDRYPQYFIHFGAK